MARSIGDYKYEAQMIAEEMAAELGVDYHDMDGDTQCELYNRGLETYFESQQMRAERD